jgi:hypothetical protein
MGIFSVEQQKLVKEHYGNMPLRAIADALNKKFGTSFTLWSVRHYCESSGIYRKKNAAHTPEMLQFLKDNIKGKKHKELTKLFNKYFGVNLSCSNIRQFLSKYKVTHHTKWGGQIKYPAGTEILRNGYINIKTQDNRIIKKQQYIWELEHGKIPEGSNVIFLDNDRTNFNLDNLALVTDTEHFLMNILKLRFNDRELTKTGLAIAKHRIAIKGAIKRKPRET